MTNEIKRFFETETYQVDRGYTVHISRAPEYATEAVVEDADGKMILVDVSNVPYDDFESFMDAIVEKYEFIPPLVGLKEVAEIIGVPKSTLAQYRMRGFPKKWPPFPDPVQELASGPVWRKSDIEKFKEEL